MYISDVLHEIISADLEAKAIYAVARQEQADFEALIEKYKNRLREEQFKKADEALAEFEARESAAADAAIKELDSMLETDLESARVHFEAIREKITDLLFDAVVDMDA